MGIKLGSGIDDDLAEELRSQAAPYLQPEEKIRVLVRGHKWAADLLVLTNTRFLMLSTLGEGELKDSFELERVISVGTSFHDGDPILQVPLTEDGYFVIRLRDAADHEFLAQRIHKAVKRLRVSAAREGGNGTPGINVEEMGIDGINLIIGREEVEQLDLKPVLGSLNRLLESPSSARFCMERVSIYVDGYNSVREELWEIPEVRNYFYELDEAFPYWLFFLDKKTNGLTVLSLCFMPPFLTDAGKKAVFGKALDDILSRRWFPAMDEVCQFVGMDSMDIDALGQRAIRYFAGQPMQG